MFNNKTILNVDFKDQKVLLRCDFNVKIQNGIITDETRIQGALPTINYLIDGGAKIILCSHRGKPKGKYDPELTLEPVAKRLSEILGQEIYFKSEPQVITREIKDAIDQLEQGQIVLLDNTRFRIEETENGESFSKELASLADIFVNDAFGTVHRAHASTEGVTHYMKESVSGFLIEKELKFLGQAIDKPQRPFIAILGGAKVSDKIKVIDELIGKVDGLIIGGGMAYTFLKAQGYEIGNSMCEEDKLDYALEMIEKAKRMGVTLRLPVDHSVSKSFADIPAIITEGQDIPEGTMGLDIGPKTIKNYVGSLKNAKTILWNGPMGVFEFENYNKGTLALAKCMSALDAVTIVGGGDSAAAVAQLGYKDQMTHISTGGGASLKFLEGSILPGIEALDNL